MSKQDDELETLTSEQAAEESQIYPVTPARLLGEGKLQRRKIGRAWRIPRAPLVAFLNTPEPETRG